MAASELKSELAVTQVSLDVQKKMYSSSHPSVIDLANKVSELEKQMNIFMLLFLSIVEY